MFSDSEIEHYETTLKKLQKSRSKLKGETVHDTTLRTMLNFGFHYQYFPTKERKKGVFNNGKKFLL